jgi:ribosome-associated protein
MTPALSIDALQPWIERTFDRSAGPGGQNVNKLSTRATLWFDFEQCNLLNPTQRDAIRTRLRTRLAADGRLRIVSQDDRSQKANIECAEQRLLELLTRALHVERPRIATKPSRGSKKRRLNEKRRRGDVKRERRTRPDSE